MGEIVDFNGLGKDKNNESAVKLKPAEELAMLVMARDSSAISYAHSLNEFAEGQVSLAVFLNRCQRCLDLARKARNMFSGDLLIGVPVSEAFDHAARQFADLSPTVIETRLYNNKKIVERFRDTGKYNRYNAEIQFIYDMFKCPKIKNDVTYYARQVDYAIGTMYADGRFSEKEILDTAIRCSAINDSVETLMLPIMLLREDMMRQDREFVAARVAEGVDIDTAIEVCKKQMNHRPGDEAYYAEIREYVRRKESELA